jgi:hypothetical protein
MKVVHLALALFATLVGCSTYSENGLASRLDDRLLGRFGVSRAGFDEMPLASDAYRIHAYGNQNVSREKTAAVALVRAAELASAHGYDRFVIVDYDQWVSTSYYTTPTTATTDSLTSTRFSARVTAYNTGSYTHGDIYGHANSSTTSTTTIHHGETYAVDKPKTDIVVVFVPEDDPQASRALLVEQIFARYGKLTDRKANEAPAIATAGSTAATRPAPPVAITEKQEAADYGVSSQSARSVALAGSNSGQPTLDEVYKSLSVSEKERVNRMPLAQRADYLEEIRRRQF